MKVVLTGAGGFIGRALMRAFAAQGDEVTAIVRRPPVEPPAVPWEIAPLGTPLPERLLAGADQMIHLAHDPQPGQSARNVEGTKLWIRQAEGAGVPLQIYFSSYSAHPRARSEYGRAKFAIECCVLDRGGLVVRPGLVVGRGGLFGDLVRASARWPLFPVMGGHELRVFLTGIQELVALVANSRPLPHTQPLNVFSPEPLSLQALVDGVRRFLGVRGMTLGIPVALAERALAVAARLHVSGRRYHGSFIGLVESQSYGYRSSYPALGLAGRPLEHMLADTFGCGAVGA